jgi:hypothetical protein
LAYVFHGGSIDQCAGQVQSSWETPVPWFKELCE